MEFISENKDLILSLTGLVAVDVAGYIIAKSDKTTALSIGDFAINLAKKVLLKVFKK